MSIRVGILGYGNLGRGVECAVKQNDDMELAAVFTRRDPSGVTILTEGVPVCSVDDAADWKDKIDVLILCECGCCGEGEWKSRNYFRRLGSGYVLFKQIVCKRDPS